MLKVSSKTTRTTLYSNDWVSLKELKNPDEGVHGYSYLHESRCDGKIIVLLPFRTRGRDEEYLLRKEVTPCWSMSQVLSSITGGYEKDKGIKGTAVMELEEEAGYEATEEDLIPLGTCRGTKSCDTIYHLFSVDLTGKKKTTDAKGDGSELEAKAECVWKKSIHDCVDPMAYVAYVRLNDLD